MAIVTRPMSLRPSFKRHLKRRICSSRVALEVLFAAILIDAVEAALEHVKEALNRVGRDQQE